MADSPRTSWHVARGLAAAAAGAAVGAIAPVALMVGFTACRWMAEGAPEFDRRLDIQKLRSSLVYPMVGCALVLACAGWATLGPPGLHRFPGTFAILAASAVFGWTILGGMFLAPLTHEDSPVHPMFEPARLAVFLAPPIIAAVVLSAVRARAASAEQAPTARG
ncbi:hypothetical protein [Paludisphaera mucosa]|uniref:Uncharacterized protein n=1 Tax=Paludisphaera mucosa TaxID=3030827 RepID=A0ABT6FK71_9BACT|nr:hypothetical protein [Paludisphaera mucosa]MDG3007977.1 hypothetical protein [Paludisphaera mucosa]